MIRNHGIRATKEQSTSPSGHITAGAVAAAALIQHWPLQTQVRDNTAITLAQSRSRHVKSQRKTAKIDEHERAKRAMVRTPALNFRSALAMRSSMTPSSQRIFFSNFHCPSLLPSCRNERRFGKRVYLLCTLRSCGSPATRALYAPRAAFAAPAPPPLCSAEQRSISSVMQ